MFDMQKLSPESRALLYGIGGRDGNISDLSQVDLEHASSEQISVLMSHLKKDGYNLNEQELSRAILQMTKDTASTSGAAEFKAFRFDTGSVTSVSFEGNVIAKTVAATPITLSGSQVRDLVLNAGTVSKAAFLHENKLDSKYLNRDGRINDSLKARQKLADQYGFHPTNPYDLKEMAKLKGSIARADVPKFMELYMTAFYEHPGDGTAWNTWMSGDQLSQAVLFSTPSMLDQMPDGRRLVDCQGFSRLGEILMDTLIPGKDQANVFYKSIRIPGHELALMRDGGRLYIIDNNEVTELKVSKAELDYLGAVVKTFKDMPFDIALDDVDIPKSSVPTLYDYMKKNHPSLKGTISWDDGDALVDG
jgi:hypothetical protein